ncbi:MAG: LPS export ABC transporter periplasmic protein LptC [Guyparkeria sp.]
MRRPLSSRVGRSLLAIVGLGLLGWLVWHNVADTLVPPTGTDGGYAQRLDNAITWQYDEAGKLAYRVESPQAVQLDNAPAGDRYELDSPHTTLVNADTNVPPWTLRADAGTVTDRGQTVELVGSVHAQREPHGERGRLELTTEQLWLYPDERRAQSDVPGRMSEAASDGTPRWHSAADQLALDWGDEVLTQTDQVRDEIRPGSTGSND